MKNRTAMKSSGRLGLAAAVAFAVGFTGIVSADVRVSNSPSTSSASEVVHYIEPNERGIYIVGLKSPPLAMYDGGDARFPSVPRLADGKLDLKSVAAERYVAGLQAEQEAFLNRLSSRMGRRVAATQPHMQFQHAFNGMVLQLSPAELELVARDPEVAHLEGYREYSLLTDVGPGFIGAPAIWDGSATPNGFRSRGEGIVIGVIDSGANLGSPSFEATDKTGYTHTNPLGEGNYLGWCNPQHPNHNPTRDICNSKVIGGWDFSDNQITGNNREAPGFEDENGHGSHTAATAGGNIRDGVIGGFPVEIQGVAPRANLVIYDACYTPPPPANGACGNDATLASINQTVADGVVDVINYSISGGGQPWLEANSLAFLAATNAGIYVSASAGNSGPAAATVAHNEPWVTTVASSTHSRESFANLFSVTGPGTPSASVTDLPTNSGVNPPLNNTFPLQNVPLVLSPNFGTPQSDGCVAYPPNTFVREVVSGDAIFRSSFEAGEIAIPPPQGGAIALLRWPNGTSDCGTVARANAAAAAGARAVVFLPEASLNAAGGAQVPVFVLYRTDSHAAVISAIEANPATAVGTLVETLAPIVNLAAADSMSDFSSRGPNAFNMLKPDVSAPGDSVLAAVSRWNRATAPGTLVPELGGAIGVLGGTSMSSPHNAGAAALLKAVNRTWKPVEIKTALMTTSIQNMRKEDGVSPADPHDYGAGRIDLTRAAEAGLLMDETGANFTAANPATGGNAATLNLPSFQLQSCTGTCALERRVRNARSGVVWTATIEGLPLDSATVTPASITPSTAAPTSFTLSVNSGMLPGGVWSFGQVVWTPNNPDVPVARMPIAVRAAGPQIQVPETSLSAFALTDTVATRSVTINNIGNPTLNWETLADGDQATTTFMANAPALGTGFQGSEHAASETGSGYNADDILLSNNGTVTHIETEGFILGTGSLANATAVNVRIYADASGVPAGAPRNNGSNVGAAPLFSASIPVGTPGLSVGGGAFGGRISIDIAAAGLTVPSLPTGRHWVVVYPTLPGTGAPGQLRWISAIVGTGAPVSGLAPVRRNSTAAAVWATPSTAGGPASGFAMTVRGTVGCGAPWLSTTPASGALGLAGSESVTVNFNAAGLSPGVYTANLCFGSNSSTPGDAILPVTLTVPSGETAPSISKAFAPSSIGTVTTSRLVLTLSNPGIEAQALTSPLVDSFPAGLVVAQSPAVETTCSNPSVTATPGADSISIGSGTTIPAVGSCQVSVRVNSPTPGEYLNEIAVGALVTPGGSNADATSATLVVSAGAFPAPYCGINFTTSADPISLVRFAGIDNPSSAVTGAGPALSDFLAIQGTVTRGESSSMTVKGNTDGNFPYQVIAYIDWNNDGVFAASEATVIGTITNSNGADAVEVVGSVAVPLTAATGSTRMRVVFQNPTVAGPCAGGGFGSAEDYTIVVN